MNYNNDNLEQLNKKQRKRHLWMRVMSVLMCITMFVTTYALVIPAVTMDVDEAAKCGFVHHKHSAECYDDNGALTCGLIEHEHDMSCFVTAKEPYPYYCGHYYEHTHTDECYTNGILTCTYTEHTHTSACQRKPMLLSATPSVDSYLATSGANQWQIVTNGTNGQNGYHSKYEGNTINYKKPIDDNNDGIPDAYLQKNVIPTNVENEFLVYLSMSKPLSLEEWLRNTDIVTTTFKQPGAVGTYSSGFGGNKSTLYVDPNQGANRVKVNITIYDHADIISNKDGSITVRNPGTILAHFEDIRSTDTSACSNGSVLIPLEGTPYEYDIQYGVNFHPEQNGQGVPLNIAISLADLSSLGFQLYETHFDTVEDQLGENIEFVNVEYSDGSCICENGILQWTPTENLDSKQYSVSPRVNGWANNVSQLVYRVRLNTAADGFNSCANNMNSVPTDQESYAVNDHATVTYQIQPMEGSSLSPVTGLEGTFPIPYVRGLLYDMEILKISSGTTPLGGAEFSLFESDGVTPVLDEYGNPYVRRTDMTSGKVRFENLLTGTYIVKETEAPLGYAIASPGQWSRNLCWTTSTTGLAQDVQIPENKIYGQNGTWRIQNTLMPNSQTVRLVKVDAGDDQTKLDSAMFDLYGSDENGDMDDTPIYGYAGMESNVHGVISAVDIVLPFGTYWLVETAAPDGYQLCEEPIRIVVSASGVSADLDGDALNVYGNPFVINIPNDKLPAKLTVTKTVVSSSPDTAGKFPMSVILDGGTFLTPAEDAGYTLSDDGTIAYFSLAHGETIDVMVPRNVSFTVCETEHNGYYVSYSKDGSQLTDGDTVRFNSGIDSTATVDFVNNVGQILPATGGHGSLIYVITGLILMVSAIIFGYVLRRKREGREF